MLCQNCGEKEATVHLKRVMGGEAVELHLCGDCAAAMGYGELFAGFPADPAGLFGALAGGLRGRGGRTLRCETCGLSFEDIAAASRVGCPDCYRVFGEKLEPLLRRLHGRAAFQGRVPESAARSSAADPGNGEKED